MLHSWIVEFFVAGFLQYQMNFGVFLGGVNQGQVG